MVAKHGYDWSDPNRPPEIDSHSIAKHNVVRAYVERYIRVLTADPRIDVLRINFVDGFAGGGLYRHNGSPHLGSPLLLLDTVRATEQAIRAERTKPFEIRARYFFVEQHRGTFEALTRNLIAAGHSIDGSVGIHAAHGSFIDALGAIVESIKADGGQKRTVFLLDQYGYKDVPFGHLKLILGALPYAEIILTFATDALINYMSTEPQFLKAINGLGLDRDFKAEDIEDLQESSETRFAVEKLLCEHMHRQSGAAFLTPFFIRSPQSHRSYWLVHLSSHPRARDEMTGIHWKLTNHFCHYGKAGLNMLGYDPSKESFGQAVFDFYFDGSAEQRTHRALMDDIPPMLSFERPITFEQLFRETCNQTPAHSEHMKRALFELHRVKVIEIVTARRGERRSAAAIRGDDVIALHRTFRLFPI